LSVAENEKSKYKEKYREETNASSFAAYTGVLFSSGERSV